MPKASVKRIIDKRKDKLIEFVLDIEKYPEFIPFCLGSKVYEKKVENDQILIIADLTIGKGLFSDTYKSDVRFNKKNDTINVTNLEGPLKHLQNNWKFVKNNNMTEVYFDVDFEIKNKFLNLLMEKSFEFGLNKIADAFQKKAESI
jgi:coenzyme Q-binding protein COQ10